MEIIPEPEWKEIVHTLMRHRGKTIIIGDTDSGKSTLARYLISALLSHNMAVTLIDSDIGQSSLGMPGTITTKTFMTINDLKNFIPDTTTFIGTLNPANKIPQVIGTTRRMVERAMDKGVANVIVDTTGLISGDVGREIKTGKIRTVKPVHIIALQLVDELEHILTHVEDVHVHRLSPSRLVRRRNREARMQYRQKKIRGYFRNAESIGLDLKKLTFIYNDRPFTIQVDGIQEGTLVGLDRDEETLALGIVEELGHRSIILKSPIDQFKGINRIIVGDIILDPEEYPL